MTTVLYFTSEKLVVYEVSKNEVAEVGKVDWTPELLPKEFGQIKEQLGAKKVRLLLEDDLSSLLLVKVPEKEKNEREYVKKRVQEKKPEILSEDNWDFVEVTMVDEVKGKYVAVFALADKVWKALVESFNRSGIKLEAVESVALAKRRDENPVIGLALKEDLRGKDEEVLNLTVEKQETSNKQQATGAEKKEPKFKMGYVVAFLIAIILGAIIVGGIVVSRNALQ